MKHTRLILETLSQLPVAQRRIELVERKGIGHPDTICDSVAEAISCALARMYLDRIGMIPHYNIDKALLIAGECRKKFGWAEQRKPMQLFIGDRATFQVAGIDLPVVDTALSAVDGWIRGHLPHVRPGHDLNTHILLAHGSDQLCGILKPAVAVPLSNDTCGASGFAPFTPTEQLVLAVEQYLSSTAFKSAFPDTGEDVKVFGSRRDDHLALVVAMPLLCRAISSERAYFDRKGEIIANLVQTFRDAPFAIDWHLNNLDEPGEGSEGCYLSLLGTSAEDADSGQVGRGNRVNGLIAFSRPTGGEAAAGKNPIAHTGKIYSVLSQRLAEIIYQRYAGLAEVYVHLSARIGEPVDEPAVGVQLVLPSGAQLQEADQAMIASIIDSELARLPEFQMELVAGKHPVC